MIQSIKLILQQFINDIDSGNSNVSESEQIELLQILLKIGLLELSKIESANYIGVSRATFDNYIKKGLIPEGHKRQGFKELSWNKNDLNEFMKNGKVIRKQL